MSDTLSIITGAVNSKAIESQQPGDILARYEHLRITAEKPIEMPEAIVKIHGIQISTRKSLTMLSGPSKAGKSAITSVISAGAICTANGYDGCEYIEIQSNSDLHAVIHIDTEQSQYHHYRNFKNAVLKRARIETAPHHYYSYNIRQLNLPEYRPFIESIFQATTQKHGGIHLAVIDGIADFINSVNDEEESNGIVSFFEHLAIKYDTAIILVLHNNPGSDKQRGHLGSQLQRKCESVLAIQKDGDRSVLSASLLRSGGNNEFTPITYQYDRGAGYHVFINTGPSAKEAERRTLAVRILQGGKELPATKLKEEIMDITLKSDKMARIYMEDMVKMGIVKVREDGNRNYYSLVDPDAPPF